MKKALLVNFVVFILAFFFGRLSVNTLVEPIGVKVPDTAGQSVEPSNRRQSGAGTKVAKDSQRSASVSGKSRQEILMERVSSSEFSLFNNEGEVNRTALNHAGIDGSEIETIQKLVDKTLEEVSDLISSKAIKNERLSSDEKGTVVYDIPSFLEEGKKILGQLDQSLSQLYGSSASETLLSGFNREGRFGEMGLRQTRVTFSERTPTQFDIHTGEQGSINFSIQMSDPLTGDWVMTINTTNIQVVRKYLGDSFVLPE